MDEAFGANSVVEDGGNTVAWDSVTYVVFAAERQCLPEDFEHRHRWPGMLSANLGRPMTYTTGGAARLLARVH